MVLVAGHCDLVGAAILCRLESPGCRNTLGSPVTPTWPRGAPRILYVVTHPMTANILMRGQLRYMREAGFELAVVSGPGPELDEIKAREDVATYSVPLRREIGLAADIRALLGLRKRMRIFKPDVVVASTPKAGLLGMFAAWVERIPVRVYLVRGLRLETTSGLRRFLLCCAERIASKCATRVAAVSPSLRRRYLKLRLTNPGKIFVAGGGSSNGVDVTRFRPADSPGRVARLRSRLGIPQDAPVIGFVGRLTADKGISDLVRAFTGEIRSRFAGAQLVLVGDFEDGDPVTAATQQIVRTDPEIRLLGFVSDAAPYYRLFDVLAFPSYREGFPNVPLEAGASMVPIVGYAVTGTVDAVVDGETGRLVAAGDRAALARAICAYLEDTQLRRRHGAAARERAVREYRSEKVWKHGHSRYTRSWVGTRWDAPLIHPHDDRRCVLRGGQAPPGFIALRSDGSVDLAANRLLGSPCPVRSWPTCHLPADKTRAERSTVHHVQVPQHARRA